MFSPVSVCWFVRQQVYAKTTEPISTNVGGGMGGMGPGPGKNPLSFGVDAD